MLNVLLCSPLNGTGGITQWTQHIMKYYNAYGTRDVELSLLPMDRKTYIEESTSSLKRFASGFKEYTQIIRSISTKLKSQRFNVVHLVSSASLGLLKDQVIIRRIMKAKTKVVIHFRFGRIPNLFARPNWETRLIKKVISRVDEAIVIDERSYQTLLANGFTNVTYLPNPVSPAIQNIINDNPRIQRKPRTLVFVGHVIPTKGINELVEACNQIPNIQLRILGQYTEETKQHLLSLASIREGDNNWMTLTGNLPFEEVIKELLSASVFVLPTYTEGFPNVILESMACGCPIVTTDVGAIPEMLDIKNGSNYGICVKPKQVKELKEAIEKMLDDEAYACRCGRNAQHRVNEMYSMDSVWKQLVQIWNETANN